ncbi:PA14 domain-containing protein [Cesiribacter sp. SM1]|uniref:PA14 domain-containing protein n=1 Tax=Cesiribacter sp. SM1 TaxID=2861196 RepID=UPI001CD1EA30|nr:PA14 domain-containing protein [Cesiribacter sp. SM1]
MKKSLPLHHFDLVRWAFVLFTVFVVSQPVFSQQSSRRLITKGTSGTPFGFFEYLPAGYSSSSEKKPLILYLHGAGELGNGTSDLSKMYQRALPKLLKNGKEIDFVVIAPQAPSWWHYHDLMPMLNWIKENYNIDTERIYLTGISMGGTKVWDFAGDHPDQITAVSPLGADARNQDVCRLSSVPVWAFHGKNDNVYPASSMMAAINTLNNSCNPVANPPAQGTIYSQHGHDDLWDYVYNGTYGDDVYAWMLQHRKPGTTPPPPTNQPPSANAGPDINIKLPTNSVTISGSGSDTDGTISAYKWSKISGPAATLSQTTTPSLYAYELVAGTYEFELMVTDNAGATAKDRMKLNVAAADDDDDPVSTAGLNYKYYEGSWSVLPDFGSLTPKKTGTVSNFSLSPKSRNNKFAFLYEGYINIATAGTYTFYTASDDGSKLYINGSQLVNNDGLHALQERSGSVYLTAGTHPIKVTYFEYCGSSETLNVSFKGPGFSKKKIPNDVLSTGGSASSTPPAGTNAGLSYKYYEGSWSVLPNFSSLTPKKTGTVNNFSLAPRKSNNLFGFVFEGYIEISTAGTYTFYTQSDDGSKLYINGQQIVNNDGMHALQERSGTVQLAAGLHPIRVTYFEKYSGEQLSVSYSGPGISKRTIPDAVLSTGSNSSSTTSTSDVRSDAEDLQEAATVTINTTESLQLLNNPVTDGWLRIATREANLLQEGEVFFYDTAGRRYQSVLVEGASLNTWEVSTRQLHRGIYVLLIKQADGQERRLRFIQR